MLIDRHPCPSLRDDYSGRGWLFFRSGRGAEPPLINAVFCAPLPSRCAIAIDVTEYFSAPLHEVRPEVETRAWAIEQHARTCTRCADLLAVAIAHARLAAR
ncbi:hypothetical protein [Nocardiopsis chromatogenes]|uniref:hypothetical protein n=1 Tax=Nocardiopsis chromatogenes TaxID=280239 RepID=UPI00034D59F2|nr:hypothetical protein [Nocardiopsis chromatogenes]